jgi:hypothetical protein
MLLLVSDFATFLRMKSAAECKLAHASLGVDILTVRFNDLRDLGKVIVQRLMPGEMGHDGPCFRLCVRD